MYVLPDYNHMVADEARMRAYAGALADVVRPGAVVLDIGAGSGVASIMACKLGARRVFAVEISDALSLARELAIENGVEDRIEFIQMDSRKLELPEQADVIVSDLRGSLPFFHDHFEVIADARKRHLAPGGCLIPERDTLWAGVVECPKIYDDHLGPRSLHGVTLDAARRANAQFPAYDDGGAWDTSLLSEAHSWAVLDYRQIESAPVHGKAEFRISTPGTAHGALVWFEALLREGRGYQSGPDRSSARIYKRAILPFEHPIPVREHDRLGLEVWVGPQGEPFTWHVTATAADGTPLARMRQSTFLVAVRAPVRIHTAADTGA